VLIKKNEKLLSGTANDCYEARRIGAPAVDRSTTMTNRLLAFDAPTHVAVRHARTAVERSIAAEEVWIVLLKGAS
jgi:hypothetical protein